MRLVEPNIANASVCSLLKSLSSGYSSEQLAARHCFPLEDPPDDKKNLAGAEGYVFFNVSPLYALKLVTFLTIFLILNCEFAELQLKQPYMKLRRTRMKMLKNWRKILIPLLYMMMKIMATRILPLKKIIEERIMYLRIRKMQLLPDRTVQTDLIL